MKKIILAILDGVGYRSEIYGNALKQADTKNLDNLLKEYPYSYLKASGNAVGLPDNQMGNSEVGHLTIGSGRVTLMPLERINRSIIDKSFFKNEYLNKAIEHAKENNSKLHIIGLLSDGGVHSHINHILRLIDLAKEKEVKKLYLHLFLDGRDTLPNVAEKYINELENYLKEKEIGKIATIEGRYYGMDREGMWNLIEQSYNAMVRKIGNKSNKPIADILKENYANGIYDEFIPPYVIDENGNIENNDAFIVANFRPDRLVEILTSLTDKSFDKFKRDEIENLYGVTMMPVSNKIKCDSVFKEEQIKNTLGEILEKSNIKSLRIAEVSKFPHVTHFFDGDRDIEYKNTKKIKVPRKDVKTYDLYPAMSAKEVTDMIIKEKDNYDFILVNYANGDMVGHTGNFNAAKEAMETVDHCIKRLCDNLKDYTFLITADHGNVEEMLDKDGNVLTAHTTNPVYFLILDKNYTLKDGELKDIAPTILDIMNIEKPKEMTGMSLIK